MTLVSSGRLSIGGSGASNQSIEYELYSTTDQPIDILSADCRKLCGIATGPVKFSDFYSKSYPRLVSFTASPVKVVEGNVVLFTLTTQNVPNGTTISYSVVDPTASGLNTSDINIPFSGSFQIQNNTQTTSVNILSDLNPEPVKTFYLNMYINGALFATSPTITIGADYNYGWYSAGTYSVVIPTGVTSVTAIVVGGGGGKGGKDVSHLGKDGNSGVKLSGSFSVTPGETLTIIVGGAGGNGNSDGRNTAGGAGGSGYSAGGKGGPSGADGTSGAGGGGGGSTAILRGSSVIVSAAGGGGGGGGGNNGDPADIGLGGGFAGPKSTGVGGLGYGDIYLDPGSKNDDGGGGGGGGGGYPLTNVITGGDGGKGGTGDHTGNWGQYGQSVVLAGFSQQPSDPTGGLSGYVFFNYSVMPT